MALSNADVERIRGLGFPEDLFVAERDGELQLRNIDGRCVFHDGQRCNIYDSRPHGCRLYPAVLHESKDIVVLDSYCPHCECFQLTPSISYEVVEFVQKLDEEREKRVRVVE